MKLITRVFNKIGHIHTSLRKPLEKEFAMTQKIADRKGMVCVLFTLHVPHRFHPVSPHFDGSTDQQARFFLSMLWGQVYKAVRQWNITWMGFSMIEPDLDGVSRLRVVAWLHEESIPGLRCAIRNQVLQHCKDDRCMRFAGKVECDPAFLFGEHHKFAQLTIPAVEPRRKWKDGANTLLAVLTGRAA